MLDQILTRLTCDLKAPSEKIDDFFEGGFAREILEKLVDKVRDMYCCTGCCEILAKCFITGTTSTTTFKEQLFSDQALVNALLKGISSPILHLPSYNQRTRAAVLKIYQQFTMQKQLLLNKVSHPIIFIQSVLSAIEGEKDPRNLLLCFDLTYFMLSSYMNPNSAFYKEMTSEILDQLAESFFDEIACYFPINF